MMSVTVSNEQNSLSAACASLQMFLLSPVCGLGSKAVSCFIALFWVFLIREETAGNCFCEVEDFSHDRNPI